VLDKEKIERICIDDFALKRRHRYGTVMVDIDTRRVVDMIESRETADVAKWLKTFPNIKVVARDGSSQYAAAISAAHPDAIQVNDRFHLLKNLTDYAKQIIAQLVSSKFRIKADRDVTDNKQGGYWQKPTCHGPDLPKRRHSASTEKKLATVAKVRHLAAFGLSITEIARESGITHPTIKKYLDPNFDAASQLYGMSVSSKLEPYKQTIDAMLKDRRKFKEIEDAICKDGYKGSGSTIRMYATRQRRLMKEANAASFEGTELIERKWMIKLLYKPIDNVKGITERQIDRVIKEYPQIGVVYDIVRSFKETVFAKRESEVDSWIESATSLGISEIDSFVSGLLADLEAVKNAVALDYSNGLAEGSVNKIKVIKRIMYGRNSFALLRNKTLIREYMRQIN